MSIIGETCDTKSLDGIQPGVNNAGLAPRRPDVATLACVAGNGRVGSLGDNELLMTSYKVVSGLAKEPMRSRRANF